MGKINFKTQDELANEKLVSWRENARVSAFQARAALARAGLLTAVRELAESEPDSELAIAFEYATTFEYNSDFLNQVSRALSLTPEDKDELFRLAESIKA